MSLYKSISNKLYKPIDNNKNLYTKLQSKSKNSRLYKANDNKHIYRDLNEKSQENLLDDNLIDENIDKTGYWENFYGIKCGESYTYKDLCIYILGESPKQKGNSKNAQIKRLKSKCSYIQTGKGKGTKYTVNYFYDEPVEVEDRRKEKSLEQRKKMMDVDIDVFKIALLEKFKQNNFKTFLDGKNQFFIDMFMTHDVNYRMAQFHPRHVGDELNIPTLQVMKFIKSVRSSYNSDVRKKLNILRKENLLEYEEVLCILEYEKVTDEDGEVCNGNPIKRKATGEEIKNIMKAKDKAMIWFGGLEVIDRKPQTIESVVNSKYADVFYKEVFRILKDEFNMDIIRYFYGYNFILNTESIKNEYELLKQDAINKLIEKGIIKEGDTKTFKIRMLNELYEEKMIKYYIEKVEGTNKSYKRISEIEGDNALTLIDTIININSEELPPPKYSK
ncbi:MAG: hypothetical protein SOT71_13380 [Romboutsia timonensis]|uniref:hypothetical protein n=1 Tax=Romboutsia timonensis TaxID=1776391 RepID=UPI002A75AAD3|nr:hypothetical protein [Romboutsia timonensis]MDY2883635.1 hypothetical protein [Romboutsia timonensis]